MGIQEDLERLRGHEAQMKARQGASRDALRRALEAFYDELAKAEEILAAAGAVSLPMFTDDLRGRHSWMGARGYSMEGQIVLSGGRLYSGSRHCWVEPNGRVERSNLSFLARRRAGLAKRDPYLLVHGPLPDTKFSLAPMEWMSQPPSYGYREGDLLLWASPNDESHKAAAGWLARSIARLTKPVREVGRN